jgi:integrase
MASLWKQSRSPYWTACWRDADGRQRRRSTKTTDRRLAQRIAQEFESATRKKRTLHQLEKVLRAFHEELCNESSQARSLRAFCTEWLAEKEPSVSASTFNFYRAVTGKLFAFFGERIDRSITEITRGELVEFRNRIATSVSASTVNHDLVGVQMIFGDARRRGILGENPAEGIKPVREFADQAETSRRAFTIAELRALLAVANEEWDSMIRLGFLTGARLIDIALLRWGNVDLTREELRYTAKKTGKATLIPITGALRAHLLSLPSVADLRAPLHPRALANVERRGSSASLSAQFAELLEASGLRQVQPREETKGAKRHRRNALTYHSLRHSFISFLKDAGAAQSVAMELAGHSSAEMSQLYTHADREAMTRAMASLPQL